MRNNLKQSLFVENIFSFDKRLKFLYGIWLYLHLNLQNSCLRYLQVNATDPRLKFGLRDYWVLRHIFTFVIKANKAGNPHGLIIIARDSFINSRMDTPGTSSSSDKERWGSSLDCGCWLYRGIPIEWSHFRCCILCYYSHKCLFEQFYLIFSVNNSIKNFCPWTFRMEAAETAITMLAQGKRNMVCGEIPNAVNQFQEACKVLWVVLAFIYQLSKAFLYLKMANDLIFIEMTNCSHDLY